MSIKALGKNNKGASLILVIGCVALLSVVGSMLLLITANNREMKKLEQSLQESFYQAESGSDDMASALEAMSEQILQEAFSDMLIQYSTLDDSSQREARMKDYFTAALKNKLNGASVSDIMGGTSSEVTVTASFPDDENKVVEIETGENGKSNQIRLNGVKFTYGDGKGNETTITTDIVIQAGLPDLQAGLNAGVAKADYTDFALIASDDVKRTDSGGGQVATVNGNLYAGGDISITQNAQLNLTNADKVLVKGDIFVEEGTVKIDNSGRIFSGYGVWADGIKILKNGTVIGDSNFYISDDLTVEGQGGKVGIGGTNAEYVGYSGHTDGDGARNSSAVTINNASNIHVDFSQLSRLILSGTSYIYDEDWTGIGGGPVLQGESMAYKDMQTMYLVPGPCVGSGHNPMPSSEYKDSYLTDISMVYEYQYKDAYGNKVKGTFDFSPYLNPTTPCVKRSVRLDGGATEFTYLYLNFKDEVAAVAYFEAYMNTPLGNEIKARLKNLGNSVIKPAQLNYTRGHVVSFDNSVADVVKPDESSGAYTLRIGSASLARQRQKSLFTTFCLNTNGVIDENWESVDIIKSKILVSGYSSELPSGWSKNTYTVNGKDYMFWTYKGTGDTLTSVPTGEQGFVGIMLIDGDIKISASNANINGLLLCTGNVDFGSQTTITSNKEAVEALLTVPDVAKYFRGMSTESDDSSQFVSSEAISVSFENWKKN